MAGLTVFDVVVLLLVGLLALGGLARGFVGEIVSLLAWVAGIFAVRLFYTPVKAFLAQLTGTEAGGAIAALVVLFIGGFLIVRIVGGQLSAGTKGSIIGPIDRLLGLGFGAAKGVLAAALLFIAANMVFDTIDPGEPSPPWLAEARTAPTLAMISKSLVDFVGEHGRIAPDSAGIGPGLNAGKAMEDLGRARGGDNPHDGPHDGPRDGYAPGQREALDKLLDKQEAREPSTPI
jgi:membrane protein required for colicin V production